jgi:hypothetical protein
VMQRRVKARYPHIYQINSHWRALDGAKKRRQAGCIV